MPVTTTLAAYYFALFAALGVYLPYFPRWLEAHGIRGVAMGVVSAAFPAMGVVGPPVFGWIADAFSLRGAVLRVASFGAFVAFGGISAVTLAGVVPPYVALLAAVTVFAFFRSPMVLVADVMALETRASYGGMRLWGSLGFLVAAIAAGRFVDPQRLAPVPLAIAGSLGGAFAGSLLLPGRAPRLAGPPPRAEIARLLGRGADFRLFLLVILLSQIAHSAYDLCFSLHLRDRGVTGTSAGVAWALGVLVEVGVMAGSAPIFARRSSRALLAVGVAGASARWAVLAIARSPVLIFAAQPLHGLSFALVWLASLAHVQRGVAPSALASAQGLFTATIGVGSVIGMVGWGALYEARGGSAVFGAAAAVAAAGCAVSVWFFLNGDPAARPASTTPTPAAGG